MGDSSSHPAQCKTKPFVHELLGYATSKDHVLLADLATKGSVICLVRRGPAAELAQTLYWTVTPLWRIVSLGRCFVSASTRGEFISLCARHDVEFIPPKR